MPDAKSIMIKVSIKTIPPVNGIGESWFLWSALPGISISPILGAILRLNHESESATIMVETIKRMIGSSCVKFSIYLRIRYLPSAKINLPNIAKE